MTAFVGLGAIAARALSVPVPCPLLATTGVPCPGCGMTRLADGLAHGHLLDALGTDPLGVLLVVTLGSLALIGALGRTGVRVSLPAGATRAVPTVLAGLLTLRWLAVLIGAGPVVT